MFDAILNGDGWELWLFVTCCGLFIAWVVAEVVASSSMRRRRRKREAYERYCHMVDQKPEVKS